MLFTHLGNKCFRTRDISFGKGFKDRIGMLPEEKSSGPVKWRRMRTLQDFEYYLILAWNEAFGISGFGNISDERGGVAT